MHKTPLVSIITPFYNTPVKFFQEAVQSVFDQTYSNWELILVDDGSLGVITQQALSFASQYPGKVYYFEHDQHVNLGHSAARNLGIRNAKGKYIAFLDSDDVWKKQKLEKQVSILENYPGVGMVYANTQYWFSWTNDPRDAKRDFIPKLGLSPEIIVNPPALIPLFLNGKVSVPSMNSIMIRRGIINKYEGFEEIFRYLYEDQILYVKVCSFEKVYVSNDVVDLYRQHENSTTNKASKLNEEINERKIFLKWLVVYFNREGISDVHVWRELRREIWRLSHPKWFPKLNRFQKNIRWVKKWILKIEQIILPEKLQNHLWVNINAKRNYKI